MSPLSLTVTIVSVVTVLLTVVARFWTQVLWFSQLGFQRVLFTSWGAQVAIGLVGMLVMSVCLWAAITVAYRNRPLMVQLDPAFRNLAPYRAMLTPWIKPISIGIPVIISFLVTQSMLIPSWQEILLALNAHSFGVKDPQFGLDVSFYVFILPILTTVSGFLMTTTVIAAFLNIFTNYIYGGLSLTRPFVRRSARIQLTVLAIIYAVLTAVGQWLRRYQILSADNAKFDGASYSDVHALIPAQAIMAAITLAIAVLFAISLKRGSWKLPVTGVVVMVVSGLLVGGMYPALIQKFVVEPNAQQLESPYIQRNIDATLAAYGLENVETTPYNAQTTAQAGQLKEDTASTTSIRLLDPNKVAPTFRQLQQNRQYYTFSSQLNVDRYHLDGSSRDTVIAVRELNQSGLGADQHTWVNDHTVYTHGYGVVAAYGNTVASGGYPAFWEGGIPSLGDLGEYEPRIYFGQESPEYSIVGGNTGEPRELDYPDDSAPGGQVNTTFTGNGGPDVGNPINKLLYAIRFGEMNILFSREVTSGSQILYDRDPAERVGKVAPWLTLDDHPYPAVVDMDDDPSTPKRVVWVLDGYTTTNNYPYAAHSSLDDATSDALTQRGLLGAPDQANYVRNSVKAVVDAYDGSVTLYQWDDEDPIVAAWADVFPGSITPMSEMSADLMAHMRYPEDLFKVQRTVLARYHVQDAADFYSGGDFWKVPNDPTVEGDHAQAPYYLTLKMPDQDEASFSLSSVYIIGGNTDRNVLTGFLAVDSETGTGRPGERNPGYGQLRLLELPRSSNVSGPGQVQNTFNSDSEVSRTLNLLAQQDSQVIRGNLLTLPVGGGLLYVQPVYVQSSSGTQYPLLRKVLVSFGDKVGFADTLSEALDQVFGGNSGATTGEEIVNGDEASVVEVPKEDQPTDTASAAPAPESSSQPAQSTAPAAPVAPAPPAGDAQDRLSQALNDASSAMTDADNAMKAGDWAAYGQAQQRLDDAIQRAINAQKEIDGQ
ncbi:UPF0182 family protein [Actinomyces vulturis]|uniref:UPF0182 family membrane protein n=1 Tax=Actinomyces vulturis TaxID=1857645 RepID=UPI00082E88CD|nr:UPF0182 family protein [Actinomyces vulturis]